MNKLQPRNKILFQNNEHIRTNLKLSKLKTKKWNLFKKKLKYKKKIKPEKRKHFFQKRLFEKQRLRFFYGCLSEYKLKNIYKNLKKKDNKMNIFKNFLILLERRLDINIVRLKLAKSIFQAKQLISHKKITVNNVVVNKQNFLLKKGDIINIIK